MVKGFCFEVEQSLYGMLEWMVPQRVVPPKVALYMWQACEDKVAVTVNQHWRGVKVDAEAACVLCGNKDKIVSHLMCHCELASGV